MNIPFYPAHRSNYTVGRTSDITHITFHHTAAPNTTLRFLWGDPNRNASSHYYVGIAPNPVEQYVSESDTAWTDGNRASNARSITIETRGDWRFGYNSQETLDNLIALVKDIRSRYPGIEYQIHRDVSQTVCPGDLPVGLVWKATEPEAPRKANLRLDIPDKKVVLIRDTNVWDMSFTSFAGARAVTALPAGTVIDVAGEYDHPLSKTDYYLSKYSWDNNLNNGISKADCIDYVPRPVEVPVDLPPVDNPNIPASDSSPKGGAGEIDVLPVDPNGEKLSSILLIVQKILTILERIFK